MSFGWQTESALLPKQSKPINIDSKSILKLKAVVFDKEKKVEATSASSKYTQNRNKNRVVRSTDLFDRKNSGIESRIKKDSLISDAKQNNENSIIEASLRAKAQLYEEMTAGRLTSLNNSNSNQLLINFQEKRNMPTVVHSATVSSDVKKKEEVQDDADFIEITDEFGRNRRISKRSSEYSEYILSESSKKYKKSMSTTNSIDFSDNKQGEWAWSTGHDREDTGEWIEDMIREKGLDNLMEAKIQHEINSQSKSLSKGSKIKTMWDKTLDSSAREYLDDIHNQVEVERTKRNHASKNSGNGDEMTQNKSSIEDRKQLLRKKLQEMKNEKT